MNNKVESSRELGSKIKIFLSLTICVVLLAQCQFIRIEMSNMFSPKQEVSFDLGEHRKISYYFSSFLEKPYYIHLLFEVLPLQIGVMERSFSMKNIPLDLSVECFKLEGKEEILFFKRHYTGTEQKYTSNGWNGKNPDLWGYSFGMGGFKAPTGKYRCDFLDRSSPEIRKEFVHSYVSIFSSISFK